MHAMDHDKPQECYEFLDLSDVDDSERNHLTTTLYSNSDHNLQTSSSASSWIHDNDNAAVENTTSAVKNSWHGPPFGQPNLLAARTPTAFPVVRNVVMPRLLTPLAALPLYAIVKPSLTPLASVPTVCTPPANITSGAVNSDTSSDIDYVSDNRSQSTMSPHSNAHHQQQQHQQSSNNNNQQNNIVQQRQQNQGPMYQQQFVGQPGTQVGGAMYQMLPQTIPGNVYVSNVTANVNVHGYMTHAVPQYVTSGTQSYIPPEVNSSGQIHDQIQTNNSAVHNASNIRGTARRGRGRSNGTHRREYSSRQPGTPQELGQPLIESQSVIGSPSYTQYYINPYSGYFTAPMGHPTAQHATGSPLYLTTNPGQIPMYAGHQMYAYPQGMVYPTMIPHEYGVMMDEKVDEHSQDGNNGVPNANVSCGGIIMHPLWPQQIPIEYQDPHQSDMPQEEYVQNEAEDINVNTANVVQVQTIPPPQVLPPQQQPHVLNPNVATFTSMKSQQYQYEYLSTSNIVPQPHNQQTNKPSQVVATENSPLVQNQQSKMGESKSIIVNYNNNNINNDTKGITHVPTSMVPNIIMKVPVVTTVVKSNNNLSNNVSNNSDRIYSSNISPNVNNNQNVPNSFPSSHSTNTLSLSNNPSVVCNTNNNNINVNNNNNNGNVKDDIVHKLAKATNDKLMIKNDRGNKPQVWTNSSNNKKTTATVAVSAVPSMNNKDNILPSLLPTNIQQQLNQTTIHSPAPSISPSTVNINSSAIQTANMRKKLSPPPFTNNSAVVKASSSSPFVPKAIASSSIQNIVIDNGNKTATNVVADKKTETQKNVVQLTAPTSVSVTVVPQQLITDNTKSVESKQVEALPQHNKDVNVGAFSISNSLSNQIEAKEKRGSTQVVAEVSKDIVCQVPIVAAGASSATKSWASLFSSGKQISPNTIGPSIVSLTEQSKKPIAKVFPFESSTNYTPTPPPGGISYSAASAQGLSIPLTNSIYESSKSKPILFETTSKLASDEWTFKLGQFFSKYQIDNNNVSIIPRGLTNKSNYCYINAIIQALIACPPFYNLLRSIPSQPIDLRNNSTTPIIDAMKDLSDEFSKMDAPPTIRLTRREKGQKRDETLPDVNPDTPFEPTVIHKMLNGIRSDVFQIEGRQEDAEEFLGCVLNKMNDEMLELIKLVDKTSKVVNGNDLNNSDEQTDEGSDWQVIYGNRNKGSITRTTDFGRSPISDIFRGQLRSRVQREGDASSDVVQPFFTLQLDIEKATSVKEALEVLVGKDALEGVTCSKTNQEVMAWQQVTLEELPTILILHLKCFDYKMESCTKILKTVEFPIELKIDGKLLSSKNKYTQKQRQYKLFAVVYHDGKEAIKGHYLTDVFHAGYSSWIRYDDSIVKAVAEHHVLHPRAPRIPYLLYYRRCDTIGGAHQQPHK